MQQVQLAINNISSLSTTFNGGTNLFADNAVLTQYVNQLRGLTAQQVQLALSTKLLTAEQKQQITSELGLVATENTIQSELLQTALAQAGLNAAKQEAILKSLGLQEAESGEILTEKSCTRAALEKKLALHGVTGAQAENILSALGLSEANTATSVSFDVLTASIWANVKAMAAWLVTNPVGIAALTIGAIAGTVAIINSFVTSLEESQKELSNLKSECQDIKSDLSSMNDELQTTADRIKELEKKDKLTFTEKEEYDNLVKQNKELQREIDLLEQKQKIENKNKNKAFVQTMNLDANRNTVAMGQSIGISEGQMLKGYIAQYNSVVGKVDEKSKKLADTLEPIIQEILDRWSEAAQDIEYIRNPNTEDEKAVNEWLDYINDFQDQWAISMGEKNAKTNAFNRLVNNWQFDSVVQGLQDLGKQGEVTAEMLDDPKYDEFIEKLVTLKVIDSADNLDDVALAFNNFGNSTENANDDVEETTNSIYDFIAANEELQEAIDNAFGNQSTIQSAFDKIQKGSSLSVDEVRKLVELCPKLASEFIKTSDGYTIGADKLIQANDDMLKSTKKSLQERADYLKKFLNTDYDTSKINGSYEAQKYSEWKQSITEAESELEGLNLILTLFGLTTEDSTDKIEDLSKSTSNLVSKAKNLSSAFKEQNENGKLSEDTVLSLIENGYAAALMYDNKTGAIRLNTQAYLDLANAEIQQQITEIEIAKNDAMQDKLNAEHEIVANLGWSYLDTAEAALRYQSSIDRISNAETDISAYEAQINILENLKNALGQVTGGTYGETSNSKPQSVLDFEKELAEKEHEIAMGQREENEDYYSWLLSAAHTAYDGLADYQDDLWKYEEKVYEWRKKNEQDLFDQKIENAKTLADKILNDKVEVPEEAKKLAEFNKKMQKEYGLGNVDLTKRPKVSADAMRKAGYEAEDGETATVYSSFDFLWQGDEEHGKYVAVHYTPILPDGTVLDEKTLNDYLNTLVGSDDILKADTKGIILKVDSDVDVSDADVKSLETDKPTENIQNITKACDDWDIALHEVQAEWLDLSDAAEKAGTTAANKWDYAREIVNGYITDTQNRIKELENSGGKDNKDKIKSLQKDLESYKDDLDEIDEKEIKFNVEQTKKDLKKIDKEIEKIENDSMTSDGTKLFGKEKWDTIESMYVSAAQKVQDQIDAIVKSGVKGNEDLLEELGETLDNYGDKIAELPKSAAKEEQEI